MLWLLPCVPTSINTRSTHVCSGSFPGRRAITLTCSPEPWSGRGRRAQVTLFKRNFHHVVSDAYFKAYRSVTRGNPNYFVTYGNGKSAARVVPGLRPNGAHRWYNYNRRPRCAARPRADGRACCLTASNAV